MNILLKNLFGVLLILGLYVTVPAQIPTVATVSYEDALTKADQIVANIVDQIVDQTDPVARPVAEKVVPVIVEQIASQFADSSFYSHTFDSLKKQIEDPIRAEIDIAFADDPDTREAGYIIAEQIASQIASQLLANTELDSLELKLTLERKRLVYDSDVLDYINNVLKPLQKDGENKDLPQTITGTVSGAWSGTLRAPAYKGCTAFSADWNGTWYQTDQKISTSGYGVSGTFGGLKNPFGSGHSAIQGIYYTKSIDGKNLRFRFPVNKGFKRAIFTGNVGNNAVSGTFLAVCPTNSTVGTAGTFTGKRIVNELIGIWKGVSSIDKPVECSTENPSWTAQLSELNGNISGMFKENASSSEVVGTYDKDSKEALWIAGDHAFLGIIEGSNMKGSMLDANCTPGNARLGTFEANL